MRAIANGRILRLYVKQNALISITTAVIGLWLLQVLFSYLGELDRLSEQYTIVDAFYYILYKSPYFLEQFIPTGALLGAVVGLGLLANKSELLVMQASGVSVLRIVSWALQPALLFVFIAIAINQFVLPVSNPLADHARKNQDASLAKDAILSVKGYWTVQPRYQIKNKQKIISGKEILYVDYADVQGKIGILKKWNLDNKGNIDSVAMATDGHYLGQVQSPVTDTVAHKWQLNNLTHVTINPSLSTHQHKQDQDTLTLPIAPDSVYLITREAEDLSLTQLYAHRQFMQSQGNRSLSHELAFWQKLLSPLSILALVIVACSFVFGSLRTHSLGLRIVMALVFGLLFSYIQDLVGFIALATHWSPFLMVVLPIITSGILGIWLLNRRQ